MTTVNYFIDLLNLQLNLAPETASHISTGITSTVVSTPEINPSIVIPTIVGLFLAGCAFAGIVLGWLFFYMRKYASCFVDISPQCFRSLWRLNNSRLSLLF